jgi:hypothetical protein
VLGKVRNNGRKDAQTSKSVLCVPCSYSFFSYLVLSTRHADNRAIDKKSELPVVMKYSHNAPDLVRFIMTSVTLMSAQGGGLEEHLEAGKDDAPADELGY